MGYSIIVPVKEINDYIRESVPITLGIDYDEFEIIIVPNELPTQVEACLRDPRVRVIRSGRVSPAVKRDMGAEIAKYDRLAFLDDDAYPRSDWLKQADRAFLESGAACVGGPGVTPDNDDLTQQASGLYYETLIGGGGMDFRYRPAAQGFFVDDFPTVNLIVEKQAFFAVGGFDNNYWPGEDTKFCLDLVTNGFKIWYDPEVYVWHHRRSLFRPHLKQVGNYGRHRGYFAKKLPETSFRLVYFVPSIFLIANLLLAVASFAYEPAKWLLVAMLGLYFTIAVIDVFRRTKNTAQGLLTILTVYLSHLTYGFMFLRGFCLDKNLKSQLR